MKKIKFLVILFVIVFLISIFNIYLVKTVKIENDNEVYILKKEVIELKDKITVLEKSIDYYSNIDKSKKTSVEKKDGDYEIQKCKEDIRRLEGYLRCFKDYRTITAYIKSYSDSGQNLIINFDECEMVGVDDLKKIKQLGLNVDKDFPSGYYIYNEDLDVISYSSTDLLNFYLTDSNGQTLVSRENFFDEVMKYNHLVRIVFINDKIVEISQIYTP